jgi:hypothetical protein
MIMSLAAMVASLAVLHQQGSDGHLWLYYRQLGFRWSHRLYLQLDFSSSLSSFLEGIVTTVRVRKVFSLSPDLEGYHYGESGSRCH